MADQMVLLSSSTGSRVVTVLCPECGRISRQILKESYTGNNLASLSRALTCPVCGKRYKDCSSADAYKWRTALSSYNTDNEKYNDNAKRDYKNSIDKTVNNTVSSLPQLKNDKWKGMFTSVILERGREYYQENKVEILSDSNGDSIKALVKGTKDYTVSISVFNGLPYGLKCTCPYAAKEQHCKHQAAVLFAISGEPQTSTDSSATISKTTKQITAKDDSNAPVKSSGNVSSSQTVQKPSPTKTQTVTNEKSINSLSPAPVAASTENTINKYTSFEGLDNKIDLWKRELLDTGKRNKMINYRETKRSSLRILEPEATELFNKLAFSDKALTFQRPISKDSDLRTYSIIALMETLSYNLNVQRGDIKTAGTIIEREKTLKNLRQKAKLAQEEQGTNILYLCFGFIYWREQNRDSSPWLKAPLLMMPVTIGLKSLNSPFTLSRYDDEIEVNPTLSYLFRTEYNIDLPEFDLENRSSFDEYLALIEEIVDKRGWKVMPEVSLGLLSFLKISMYHDLDVNKERIVSNPVLRAMAGDRSAEIDVPREAENYDFDAVRPEEWHEVIDSDSSQEEAILLSKLGTSFVMQGPPGTGKSQTITNIIAEALADGKKVLFVSEKAAALQVVLKRLAEVGLDDFCLSLHNYKANKKEIIDSIGANLSLKEEYVDSSELRELTELFRDREFLNKYASELHEPIAPLDESIYSAFGKITKLKQATPLEFRIEHPEDVTKDQYASFLYSVIAFEKALKGIGTKLSENPWFNTKATSSGTTFKDQLINQTDGLSDKLRSVKEKAAKIEQKLNTGKNDSLADVETLISTADVLINKPSSINRNWFDTQILFSCEQSVLEGRMHSERLSEYQDRVSGNWNDSIFDYDIAPIKEYFNDEYSWIYSTNDTNTELEQQIEDNRDIASELFEEMEVVLEAFREGSELLSYRCTESFESLEMVSKVLGLAAEAPYLEPSWFDARKNEEIVPIIREAQIHSGNIASYTEDIMNNWEASVFSIDADSMLARFKTEYVGLFHTMKPSYKEDIKTLRLHAKSIGGKIDESEAVDLLQKIKSLNDEKAWFDSHNDVFVDAIGGQYHGAETDWTRILDGMQKALDIVAVFPYANIPEETVNALVGITNSIQLSGNARRIAEVISSKEIDELKGKIATARFLSVELNECIIPKEVLPQISRFIDSCNAQSHYYTSLVENKREPVLTKKEVDDLVSDIDVITQEKKWFSDNGSTLRGLFEGSYNGSATDWISIENGLKAVRRLTELFAGNVPENVLSLACSNVTDVVDKEELLSDLIPSFNEAEEKVNAFTSYFNDADFINADLITVADKYDRCIDGFDELNKWLDYAETREECDKLGLSGFTSSVSELDNTVPDVTEAFEKAFYIQWINVQLNKVKSVQTFRKRVHEQKLEQFVDLDSKQYEISRKRIREKIISSFPSVNTVARAGSQLGILRHQMELKRRVMPLRRLFQSIPDLLLTLKPCLMMSPLSVAYFLDADAYKFDIVIFDEASQIFPQDAIGAIFRANQVIIAGDTRQLPPTNFFAANTNNGSEGYDDDEGYDDESYDSILEETASILPSRTLLWHYRSRQEHLIAFSNQEIYKNELITFPSSNESEPDTGVEFVYVEDGYYEPSPKNYNILEAKRIVELVKEHIEKHPNRSLGIIAFSEKQQQAISLEIQRFREKNPRYETFFTEGKEEEFFVKNLENVQGDERDTIFFSIGYAKTKEQKANGRQMSLRFGPLGIAGGERRLNVAITRAKTNIKLVSSILPSDIDISRTESEGIRMLRSYIEFAMNGESSLSVSHKSVRTDDFVDSIAQFIRDNGYSVEQYIGCSGYKIDIAVKHPSEDVEEFVAAIECDGYSYVSAKTARDRDRLRGSVLKSMGWNLYRVWSAEWYKNPEVEGKRLLQFIANSIKECDRKRQLSEELQREENLKKQALEEERARKEAETKKLQEEQARKDAELKRQQEEQARREAAKILAKKDQNSQKSEEIRRLNTNKKDQDIKKEVLDLSWVVPGARVRHKSWGSGVVLNVLRINGIVDVRFSKFERSLSYPFVFETGVLTKDDSVPVNDHVVSVKGQTVTTNSNTATAGVKNAAVQNKKEEDAAGEDADASWVKEGVRVFNKVYGEGVIEEVSGTKLFVLFGKRIREFTLTSVKKGFLEKIEGSSQPEKPSAPLQQNSAQGQGLQTSEEKTGFVYDSDHKENTAVVREASDLKDYFTKNGFSVRDLRAHGGNLAVKGTEKEIRPYLDVAEELFGDIDGKFLISSGTFASQPAWVTKSPK
ncbi:MAG: DUF4011 domain-containing protein [Oscillospiraceae bacterium]|nr:DUF4011 domain-containing protein [Oscillospiraceae bacterium]